MKLLLSLCFLIGAVFAQPIPPPGTPTGPTLPATCSPSVRGQNLFVKTGASAGLYYCSAMNTWTAVGGGGGGTPATPVGSVQFNLASAFGGNAAFIENVSALPVPTAPTLATVGTPGATTYGYRILGRNLSGASAPSSQATIATGNATLDGTNFINVTVPACADPRVTSYDIYRTAHAITGLIKANAACSSTTADQGVAANNVFLSDPPSVDTSIGVGSSVPLVVRASQSAIGPFAVGYNSKFYANNNSSLLASGLAVMENEADPDFFNNTSVLTSYLYADANVTGAINFRVLTELGSDNVTSQYLQNNVSSLNLRNHTITGWVSAYNANGGITTIQDDMSPFPVSGYYGFRQERLAMSGGSVPNLFGVWIGVPTDGTITNAYLYYGEDLNNGATITNAYYSWDDSRGVRRVKEDSTFNSVGQAIEALYNPQFTKYTPGAADYERVILGQWNGNVAEIGTEAAGMGTARNLRLIGPQVLINSLKTTGAATGKTVVCVDVSTGQLYASTSGVACAN